MAFCWPRRIKNIVYLFLTAFLVSGLYSSCGLPPHSHALDFKETVVQLADKKLTVEVADTPKKQKRGLKHRESLKKNHGMLFVFKQEQELDFWMKDTLIPLSIGFFNKELELIETQDLSPARSVMDTNPERVKSAQPALLALEVNKGWFKENQISQGTKLEFPADNKKKILHTGD